VNRLTARGRRKEWSAIMNPAQLLNPKAFAKEKAAAKKKTAPNYGTFTAVI